MKAVIAGNRAQNFRNDSDGIALNCIFVLLSSAGYNGLKSKNITIF
jgi:hypothetical protein